jgi:RHS repeat-associated protein
VTAVSGSATESYSYDANGNRTLDGYVVGPGNRLSSDGTYDYTGDNEGNILTKTRIADGETTEFTWDHRNRLTQVLVKAAGGTVLKEERFTYDALDRRIGMWVDSDGPGPGAAVQMWTVYDGANAYADFDGSGALTYRYLYGQALDELFARVDAAGSNTVWHLSDRLGSVRQLVSTDGTVLDALTYDSYGNILNETNPGAGDRFKYTGREYDAVLGMYYYRARYYAPGSGRYQSEDPLTFAGGDTNLYRYVHNRPTNATDPTGTTDPGATEFLSYVLTHDELTPPPPPPPPPARAPGLPERLVGRWRVSIRVYTGDAIGHAWIHFQNVDDPTVEHTASKFGAGWGRLIDEHGRPIEGTGVTYPGTHWDKDVTNRPRHDSERSVIIENPEIYGDTAYDEQYNNCATYAQGAWFLYTGEWLAARGTLHDSPFVLKASIDRLNDRDATPAERQARRRRVQEPRRREEWRERLRTRGLHRPR